MYNLTKSTMAAALSAISILAMNVSASAETRIKEYGVWQESPAFKSQADWVDVLGKQELRLITTKEGVNSAAVVTPMFGAGKPFPQAVKTIEFTYRKFERGIIDKETADPIIRIEYKDGDKLKYRTITSREFKTKDSPGNFKIATVYIPFIFGGHGIDNVTRIAIVSKVNHQGVKLSYGDFEVLIIVVDGAGVDVKDTQTVKDPQQDELLNAP